MNSVYIQNSEILKVDNRITCIFQVIFSLEKYVTSSLRCF